MFFTIAFILYIIGGAEAAVMAKVGSNAANDTPAETKTNMATAFVCWPVFHLITLAEYLTGKSLD